MEECIPEPSFLATLLKHMNADTVTVEMLNEEANESSWVPLKGGAGKMTQRAEGPATKPSLIPGTQR